MNNVKKNQVRIHFRFYPSFHLHKFFTSPLLMRTPCGSVCPSVYTNEQLENSCTDFHENVHLGTSTNLRSTLPIVDKIGQQ